MHIYACMVPAASFAASTTEEEGEGYGEGGGRENGGMKEKRESNLDDVSHGPGWN